MIKLPSRRLTRSDVIIRLNKICKRSKYDLMFLENYASSLPLEHEDMPEILNIIRRHKATCLTLELSIKELEGK